MNFIDPTVQTDSSVKVGYYSVIEKDVKLGKNVIIGNRVTIHEGTVIGDNTTIADGAVVGKPPKPAKTSTVKLSDSIPALEVGEDVTIGANCVIYRGAKIGSSTLIADLASVRENVEIGNYVIVGRGVTVENYVTIGDRTKIQSNSYITAYTTLEEQVFIAPCVTTTNDNFMGRTEERFDKIKGAIVKKGARVGGASIILPGITIEEETFVAAGALVTKNTGAKTLVKGVPAKYVKDVDERELL
ncbi:UDP-3-O-(3-hydroxymyristoyl) glucosamine N-acyltransferase [Cytobacillus firmus]|uniref:acyltransferase n=1 Tax=Cytobacillus firmus TaxID=1399 RepID=UPI00077CD291|nr:acyltransferase [Cytobacillus firmus]MBG9544695.1 UDP-3-O-(3-hydroxymyristoyl) glucosamine N-acyltransferase [Cytobacillus firmus]MBG9554026.1 UDP-3-O-(3-hydroxymyristoyl) glucosamine N-acyltransferase [Cytobacillus firmus]MBG9558443.1 UDP-3-O-(3-hydroxymyristoyl) glucosamine N-acyltransferase [Cytobacillus firmus]MBG9577015.1 UDP-3-O-(3-hydroxymyristoyl) glucosamine N-acyltransferase [Cytobacillus firmus]MEC1894330.1 DapH/DapD/GlmU-related protein [Cytobacillus firmus]